MMDIMLEDTYDCSGSRKDKKMEEDARGLYLRPEKLGHYIWPGSLITITV